MTSQGFSQLAAELSTTYGERFTTSHSICEQHGRDESFHAAHPPEGVIFPETTEDVAQIVVACNRYRVPMIPFGVGTSLEGHVAAVKGGLSIDLSQMDKIKQVYTQDLNVVVEAGVRRRQLQSHLRDTGLFFSVDPGADATIGGMCASGASGTTTVRYGTMRENVLGLTVVTPTGEIIHTGTRARKSSAGYDLTRLMIGSEGTLGIITEATLRLHGQPEAISAAICGFKTLAGAIETVIATIQMGLGVARIEVVDALQIRACNAYSGLNLNEQPTLFLEFHGTPSAVNEQTETFGALARENGAEHFDWATKEEDRSRLWTARHNAYYAALQLKPGYRSLTTDVCVPISKLDDCILETQKDISDSGLTAPMVGHVGDGNFHLMVLIDPADEKALDKANAFNERLVNRALAMDGTCTGEHGIGFGKSKWLAMEHGEAFSTMKAIKSALDPEGLMNPGKLFDT